MKKLLLPLILAVLAGLTSATAATFVNAKKASTAYAVVVADSVAKYVRDSTAAADSIENDHRVQEAEVAAAAIPMTPADSIRSAHNEPTTLKAATRGMTNAADPKRGAPSVTATAPASPAAHDGAPATTSVKNSPALPTKVAPARVVDAPRSSPAPLPASVENGLPENRIAKIFSVMQAKEAAKVLEQMTDSDIRVILSRMNDKQAAAILVSLPATRAAAISKGEALKAGTKRIDANKSDTSKNDENKGDAGKSDKTDSAKKSAGEHK